MERENYILTGMRLHKDAKEDLRILSLITKKYQNELFRQALREFIEKEAANNEHFLRAKENLKMLSE